MQARNRIPGMLLALSLAAVGGSAHAQQAFRTEKDLLGEKQVPADAYYGVQTARALENFRISGQTIGDHPDLVAALALVKMAAARANADVGAMEKSVRDAVLLSALREFNVEFTDLLRNDTFGWIAAAVAAFVAAGRLR